MHSLWCFGPSHKRVRENLCVVARALTTEASFLLIHRSYEREFEGVYVLIVVWALTTGASFCKSYSDLVNKLLQ